eukprot:4596012-Amphidinium_carterae.1
MAAAFLLASELNKLAAKVTAGTRPSFVSSGLHTLTKVYIAVLQSKKCAIYSSWPEVLGCTKSISGVVDGVLSALQAFRSMS